MESRVSSSESGAMVLVGLDEAKGGCFRRMLKVVKNQDVRLYRNGLLQMLAVGDAVIVPKPVLEEFRFKEGHKGGFVLVMDAFKEESASRVYHLDVMAENPVAMVRDGKDMVVAAGGCMSLSWQFFGSLEGGKVIKDC